MPAMPEQAPSCLLRKVRFPSHRMGMPGFGAAYRLGSRGGDIVPELVQNRTLASISARNPCRGRRYRLPTPPTKRGPARGASWAKRAAFGTHLRLAGVLELAALRFAEPGLLALLAQLPEYRGVQRGVGRLAARRPPVPL